MYAKKMREKSVGFVLSVDMNDPSTTRGVTEVLKKHLDYVPVLSEDGHVRQKMVINGIFMK